MTSFVSRPLSSRMDGLLGGTESIRWNDFYYNSICFYKSKPWRLFEDGGKKDVSVRSKIIRNLRSHKTLFQRPKKLIFRQAIQLFITSKFNQSSFFLFEWNFSSLLEFTNLEMESFVARLFGFGCIEFWLRVRVFPYQRLDQMFYPDNSMSNETLQLLMLLSYSF